MLSDKFSFSVLKESKSARLGKIFTSRGQIDTPTFMTVGTQGTIKSVFVEDAISAGAQIILSNTYHLMIRPGSDRIKRIGGLHQFMNCSLPILTDSGGFQIMSLSKLVKIDKKKGATFNSHIDGKKFVLSPEKSIKIQKDLNSDIIMVLDECPKLTKDKKILQNSIQEQRIPNLQRGPHRDSSNYVLQILHKWAYNWVFHFELSHRYHLQLIFQ